MKLSKKRMQGVNTETQMERPSGEDAAGPRMKGILMVEKYDPIQGKSEVFQRGLLSCRGQVRSPSVALWVDAGKLPALGNDALLLSH